MSGKAVVLVTGADLASPAQRLLQEFDIVYAGKAPQEAEVTALCQRYNPVAVIVRYGKVTAAMMDAAPRLKVVSKHGSGTDTIDRSAADSRGIAVVAAAGANAAAVAEHALALMLACAKSVPQLNQRMHQGLWDKATHKSLELEGRTVGLVGLGAIGRRFARMCLAMDMRVLAHDPFAKVAPDAVERVALETIWRESDVVSLHCPLTPDNRQMLNAVSLSQCRQGVIVVNTARGGLIDEGALLQAVLSGRVASAGLDSFDQEPFAAPHIFQNQSRIILSPHIGGVTGDAYIKMGVGAAQNVLQVLQQ